MPFTLTMPKLSPTMEEGTIVKWCIKLGDHVAPDNVIMEIATDKATVEHTALDEGFLRKILIENGGRAIVNQAVAIFTEKADEPIDGYIPEGALIKNDIPAVTKAPISTTVEPVKKALAEALFTLEAPLENYIFTSPLGERENRLKASPLAKKIAKEQGLAISTVKGTGAGGTITSKDLKGVQKEGMVVFGARDNPKHIPGSYEKVALTPMRRTIAKRLQEAKTFIPHFYTEMAVSMNELYHLREELKGGGINLTYNDFVLKATAMALREHKNLNSAYDDGFAVLFQTIDICVAVNIDGGLITPIIRNADFKNIGELSVEVKELAARAREGKLAPHEYKGGSFTVSNLGMYGVSSFTAIINPPQAAILAIGGVLDIPVVKEGFVVPGKVMNLVLSADHRIVDGAAAAQFLKTIKALLERPSLLIIH